MPVTDLPSEGRGQEFVQKHPALIHFGLLVLLVFSMSFSCSRMLTRPVAEDHRESVTRQVFVEGLLGPVSGIVEMKSMNWPFLAVLSVFPLCLFVLARIRVGCLSILLICGFTLFWCFIGFIPIIGAY